MKIRLILLAITLMMLVFSAGCPAPEDRPLSEGQCPEGTAPVTIVTLDGEMVIECVPVE